MYIVTLYLVSLPFIKQSYFYVQLIKIYFIKNSILVNTHCRTHDPQTNIRRPWFIDQTIVCFIIG